MSKAANKGVHSDKEYKSRTINDLSDPKKAKTSAGSLQRAGETKAIVDYVFNGSRVKLYVPSENCYIMFSLANVRCPQPSPNQAAISRGQGKFSLSLFHYSSEHCQFSKSAILPCTTTPTARAAEPFGDASKRYSRMTLMQRQVDIVCTGVTKGGVMTGDLYVGTGAQRRNYCIELVASGLVTVDQRKIDWGEAPKVLIDSQTAAQNNKLGIWSVQPVVKDEPEVETFNSDESTIDIQISEIRNGNTFYFRTVGDESAKIIDDGMKIFTDQNGTAGSPCEVKIGKVVAALFNDGSSKSWYRAKIIEKMDGGKVKVLFVDHGNAAVVSPASDLRPLDMTLGTDQIPAAAKEAVLALIKVRSLDEDDGIDAAHMFQGLAWGKELKARVHGKSEGQVLVSLYESDGDSPSINEKLTAAGLARLGSTYTNSDSLGKLKNDLKKAQEKARKSRKGMWVYGEIPEEDED